jgi:hypothetical protein
MEVWLGCLTVGAIGHALHVMQEVEVAVEVFVLELRQRAVLRSVPLPTVPPRVGG